MKIKPYAFLIFLSVLVKSGISQSGCTDPEAINYNSLAVINDGSCMYNPSTLDCISRGPLFSYATESSGIVFTNGVMWTHNDSGNPSTIFKVDTATGSLLQTVSIVNFSNTDWEDITADSNYIYVGDFGNNNGTRIDLKVLKIDKSQLASNAAQITATAQAINFSYSDQTSFASNSSNNYDCESLISIGNFLYLFTKDRGDLQTRVYKLSKTPGTYTLSPYTTYNVNGKITGADYNKQKNELALIGYMSSNKNSFIYLLNDFSGDLFFSGNKRRIEIGNSVNDWQTEGIAYGASANELFISCETSYTTATLYNTRKSTLKLVGLDAYEKNTSGINVFPNPTESVINIKCGEPILEIELWTDAGKLVFFKTLKQDNYQFNSAEFICTPSSVCTLRISTASRVYYKKVIIKSDY